jgi:hypothetical protein
MNDSPIDALVRGRHFKKCGLVVTEILACEIQVSANIAYIASHFFYQMAAAEGQSDNPYFSSLRGFSISRSNVQIVARGLTIQCVLRESGYCSAVWLDAAK